MSRLYGSSFTCDVCRQPGEFGWVYRCTQDREEVIDFAISQGYTSTFDSLGEFLVQGLGPRKRSPAARQDRFSFFQEVPPEQMVNYSPAQIHQVLRQRDNLHRVISNEKVKNGYGNAFTTAVPPPRSRGSSSEPDRVNQQFWHGLLQSECEYQVCGLCRPSAADRTYLSLDAVANDKIMPCAAVGYGFHMMGERPVTDAEVVRNLGWQTAATMGQVRPPARSLHSESSRICLPGLLQDHDNQSHCSRDQRPNGASENDSPWPPRASDQFQNRLKHSPRFEDLSVFTEHSNHIAVVSALGDSSQHPWTPPPSPSLLRLKKYTNHADLSAEYVDVTEAITPHERKDMLLSSLDEMVDDAARGNSGTVPPLRRGMKGVAVLEESTEMSVPDIIKQI